MKRTAFLALGAFLLAGCSDAVQPLAPPTEGPAQAVVANTHRPFSATFFNVCTQEIIAFSGTVHLLRRATEDGAGGFHIGTHANVQLSGVGTSTGTEYQAVQVDNFTFNVQPPFPATRTFRRNFRVIAKGQTEDLLASLHIRFTINADGETTAEFNELEFTCQ